MVDPRTSDRIVEVFGRKCRTQHDLLQAALIGAGGIDAESLKPAGSDGRVADVVFRHGPGWVFEVKSLETNRHQDGDVQGKIGERLHKDAAQFDGPILFGSMHVDVGSLPLPMAKNSLRILGQSIQDGVKDANAQIKATKKFLGAPTARGCLAVICPPHEIDHETIGWLIFDAMRQNRNRSVQAILLAMTPKLAPFGHYQSQDCALMRMSRDGVGIDDDLYLRIARAWGSIHKSLKVVEGPPPPDWHGIQNRGQ